ncbi:nuclear transport factor 2 family protein [Siculibacillus lacustris]|uniref:nuclear transport factor 2 family protein n=1 Tax=Siculibacillus lacustris TaxID=1549641 RepID=UPI0019D1DE97|nr:nuclear transport factor 2 family protein [Siculibacillus lacustris]
MTEDPTATNLAIVDAHIRGEARDPASILDLYTDDVVLEMPTRGLRFEGKPAIEANYRRMFGAIELLEIETLERFATPTRVVDDSRARFRLVGEGFDGAPLPIGSLVELRLLHVFHMRDGAIAREQVFEGWTRIDRSEGFT